jgi:hypothetical protein
MRRPLIQPITISEFGCDAEAEIFDLVIVGLEEWVGDIQAQGAEG